ncbi:unnamed protein product [Arabis nemorensis]|uniref:FBD domain-containing protein n=1 Tax=Arabis nemorensis TaxID=586526 RepID=A0A565BEJ6_9BRAS|nr:unnamed protein product [Arabis nemorensis]
MPVLLRNCPHLETLVLEGLLHFETDKCGDACECVSREDKGCSLSSSPVKKLQTRGIKGTMKEPGMIKHFMESFLCLKEMDVYAEENDPTIFKIPGMMKVVAHMLYKEFLSYDVCTLLCVRIGLNSEGGKNHRACQC